MELQKRPRDEANAALDRIDHIVVLMMENRSFDHMLGYLRLEGREDVDGLRPHMENLHEGRRHPIWHLDNTAFEETADPGHGGEQVERQIAGGTMGGFVADWIKKRGDKATADERQLPMGYYTGVDLPVYDRLAEDWCVCDRWFSSVPGATWPNRLYAMCGQSGGRRDNKKLLGKFDFPIHVYPAFVRHLDNAHQRDPSVDWRWYSARPFDIAPPTVQLADARYFFRPGDRFALYDETEAGGQPSFLDDARDGNLPSVAWVDPDFGIQARGHANDDHPPTDVRRGQSLIREVANAVMSSPQWPKTMLVVVYDEHGGMFDHVAPPAAPDDHEKMRTYGVRVPALVVSPFVEARSVGKVLFDHTSIIHTVLQRFCRDDAGRIPFMGRRVDGANHLGHLLTADQPRAAMPLPGLGLPSHGPEQDLMLSLEEHARLARPRSADPTGQRMFETAEVAPVANDLQIGLLRAGLDRRELGALTKADPGRFGS